MHPELIPECLRYDQPAHPVNGNTHTIRLPITGPDGRADLIRLQAKLTPSVKPNRSVPSATIIPVLIYPDVREAVAWLSAAFGFVERLQIGESHRSQMRFGDGAVILAEAGGDRRPPRAGELAQSVLVRVQDADAHCDRARAHGARIVSEPEEFPFGERQYTADDPAGHRWTFSQTIADVDPREWGGMPHSLD
jgi:uncharacterized glyoxalase superfamily protein PhnB